MKINRYLQILNEQKISSDIHGRIIDFFRNNSSPDDDEIHSFAEKEGVDPHKFEKYIYMILGSFLGAGKSKKFTGTYNQKQVEMGIKIEMEHTTDPLLAEKIARDHLAEIPDYYTRLMEMEKRAEIEA